MRIFITGRPGVGKTTLLMYVVEEVKKRGYKVVGFYCPEVREGGKRIGFKIVSISSGKEKWLAKVGEGKIKVGKYAVQSEAGEIIDEVKSALPSANLIAIDEIGPMEMSIPSLKDFINYAFSLNKPLIAVVHRSMKINGKIYVLTEENREGLRSKILNEVLQSL
ncbi:NTPase [Acidianus ambivalens]|uniref:Nucleoside-triphosphatase D1866_07680 n=1 Tax=Acidianus ambivalens TaxID=2283 RepID=A0A650CW28_ACIAM|nr:NTPase [Acidianus ambivalens]MQL56582.1 NTPase [Acidianus ambivalens]QGR21895.1 NTPase [Acidianus ambivalens]